jgi:hypothetical protein
MLLKKHSDFGGGKKKSDSEFLSYNLMLNSGIIATKEINILTLVLSEKKILNEKKKHSPPPLQVKWSGPYNNYNIMNSMIFYIKSIYTHTLNILYKRI